MLFRLSEFNMHANSQCIHYAENIIYKSVLSLVVSDLGHFKNECLEGIYIIKFLCSTFSFQREIWSAFSPGKVDLCSDVLRARGTSASSQRLGWFGVSLC